MNGGENMKFIKETAESELMLQEVELQSTCLSGETDYIYNNAPYGNVCQTPGGFTVNYINTH